MPSRKTARTFSNHADTAPGYWIIGVLWRVLATGVQTGNAMCLLDQIYSTGSGPPRHAHPQDEGLYVVSGKVSFSAGGVDMAATAGSLVTVPRDTEHSFVVDEDAVLINFYCPAGFELWLMGSAVPAQRNELPPADTPFPPYDLTRSLSDSYGGLPLTAERSTSANRDAFAVPAMTSRGTAKSFWFNRGCWSVLADGASTGGSYSVFEVEQPSGVAANPQIYDETDIAVYVLEGEMEFFVDDRLEKLSPGSFAFAPRGTVRSLRVTADTARFLTIHTTPGYEHVLRTLGTEASGPVLPAHELAVPSPDRVAQVHATLGIRTIQIPAQFSL